MLEAGVRWKWIEDNPAALVKNPEPRAGRDRSVRVAGTEIDAIVAELDDDRRRAGRVPRAAAACGRRRRSAASGATSTSSGGCSRVRRAYAKGRLKDFAKTAGSTPARAAARAHGRRRSSDARQAPRDPVPAPAGGRIDINNWRNRGWTPALEAAGVEHRRIYDLRHTYATWSLAAGIDIFTLARRMGTSVKMIDRTYGHLVAGADDYERELLDAFDARSEAFRRCVGAEIPEARSESA